MERVLLTLCVYRGTFIEFRTGMVNVSPVGRNASSDERNAYEKYDKEHKIRELMIEEIHKRFPDLGLTYSIGLHLPLHFPLQRLFLFLSFLQC